VNLEQLQKEIAEDEGCVHEIYLDHLGLPTFGIGHLVKETDPEYDQPVGTPVSEDRVDACFASDIWWIILYRGNHGSSNYRSCSNCGE
jgi:GH24 family phage-related lysozyme (muramidase)